MFGSLFSCAISNHIHFDCWIMPAVFADSTFAVNSVEATQYPSTTTRYSPVLYLNNYMKIYSLRANQ